VDGILSSVVLSWLPPGLFLALVYRRKARPAFRLRFVVLTFVAGMFAATLAFASFHALELVQVYAGVLNGTSRVDAEWLVFALGVVGPAEEVFKLSAVVLTAGVAGVLREPQDGVLYSSASALGFAASENWYAMYASGGPDPGRAALVPFVHMLFSAFLGWGLGRSIDRGGRSLPIWGGLVLASAYHGLFDVLEFRGGLWHFGTMPLVALLWYFLTQNLGREEPRRS
jgi:RsiW-degrading membrane proteinase PrsW (M82 family)